MSEFHNAGVVYNRLFAENIIIDYSVGTFVATFIDLSGAGFTDTRPDLKTLGKLFNLLFLCKESVPDWLETLFDEDGDEPDECLVSDNNRQKRGKHSVAGDGMPRYLGALISTLLTDLYNNARDVYLDLKFFAENTNDAIRRCDLDDSFIENRLQHRSDKFYGRQVEISMLVHLSESIFTLCDRPLIATISGCPGAGKSTLVNQLKQPLQKKGGSFVEGKFHKLVRPDIILIASLDSFFGDIIHSDPKESHSPMRVRILESIGFDNVVLTEAIPNLRIFLDAGSEHKHCNIPSKGMVPTSHQLGFLICRLLAAIAVKEHPLILFLDDLQWADNTILSKICVFELNDCLAHSHRLS